MGLLLCQFAPLGEAAVFGAEDIARITAAFDDALKQLGLVDRKDPIVLVVARTTVQLAKEGERDPKSLSDRTFASTALGHGFGRGCSLYARVCWQTKAGVIQAPRLRPFAKPARAETRHQNGHRGEAGGSSTFIFAPSLARPRPRSQLQSSRRARGAAKRVLEFLSASFSRTPRCGSRRKRRAVG